MNERYARQKVGHLTTFEKIAREHGLDIEDILAMF